MARNLDLLLVEDSADDAELVLLQLRRHGFTPHCVRVESERSTAAALQQRSWDLVISDFSLPGFGGPAALELRNRLAPDVPFILVSGAIGEDRAVQVMKAGAQDYVLKDNLGRLGQTVDHVVEKARLRREARRTDERRREAEGLFRALFDSSLELVYLHDFEGRFVHANDRALALFGYERAELCGLGFDDLLSDPEDRRRARAAAQHILETGRDSGLHEYAIQVAGGRTVWVEVTGTRVDRDGAPLRILGVGRDITERKRLEANLAQSERLASMGMLAAGVAHEINNPLTYVLYNLQSLVDDLPALTEALCSLRRAVGEARAQELLGPVAEALSPEQLRDLHDRANDAVEGACRVRDIVRELKTFSRVDEEQVAPVDLNEAIETAISMALVEIKYRARLVKELGDLPPLLANDGKLAQVFLNLLVNATQAIPEGDVEHNEIRVRTRVDGETLVAEVSDTGCGISEEHLGQLFEPFFSTKKPGVGTGLGLFICHNIVSSMGGTLSVDSEPGRGARFVVRLPVEPVEQLASGAGRAQHEPGLQGRLLLVDDERHIGAVMAQMLGAAHDTVYASSGARAMDILQEDEEFDGIVCDLMMPEMTGMDLYEWLRARNPRLAERMVFTTGGVFTQKAKDFLRSVDNPRIDKPLDPDKLMGCLSQALSARDEWPGSVQ